MRFSPQNRLRLLVALLAVVAVAGLTSLVTLTAAPEAPTDDAPLATAPPVAPPPTGPLALPPPLPPVPLPPPVVPLPPAPTLLPPPGPRPPAAGPPCVAPPNPVQRDVDVSDPADAVWPAANGRKVVVYFETGRLPFRYANAVRIATQLWSRSSCIDAVAAPACPPSSHCSTVTTQVSGGGAEQDGNSESRTRGDVRIGNAITLYTGLLDTSSDNGALGTIVHEMGHALGLRHRNDPRSIMNGTTGDTADPRPDATDFFNLAVLYGERPGAG